MKRTTTHGWLFGLLVAGTVFGVGCADDADDAPERTIGGAGSTSINSIAGGTSRGGTGTTLIGGAGSTVINSATGGNRGDGTGTALIGGATSQSGAHTGGKAGAAAGQNQGGDQGVAGNAALAGMTGHAEIAGMAGAAGARANPSAPPVTCTVVTDKTKPITVASGRNVYCAIDLGSNNAKLQTLSMIPGQPLTFKNERQCRSKLGFGAIVFDSATQTSKPLPSAQTEQLISVMKEFQHICALDGGAMVGVDATQWARDATNMIEVKAAVKTATSLEIEVLTPEAEGIYGYVAATRNTPERFALDPGSNSFQISWWSKNATAPSTVSIPFGYVRGGAAYYPANTSDSYPVARQQHEEALTSKIGAALGALQPPSSLAQLKQAVADGNLKGELFLVGQDGAMHLALRGQLRDASTGVWINTVEAYKARVAQEVPQTDVRYGEITTVLLPSELDTFFTDVMTPASFLTLRTDPVRPIYGETTLANAALLDTLIRELGLTTVVAVPQEMPTGYILARLAQ